MRLSEIAHAHASTCNPSGGQLARGSPVQAAVVLVPRSQCGYACAHNTRPSGCRGLCPKHDSIRSSSVE
ncbi:hypothetical protein GGP41_006502 [Bipolaris sorokiniana]|uniref:Uncharacterized protein n=1 Tax=Cochliobolus sativus TaxID=45130 RepID=A0A8H5ZNU9_COCSA|nr:hypothetical protein GGP41_006502 [Bipolaris sorokiniana]